MTKDLLREEYVSLRSEIEQNGHIVATVFLASISVTAALIGFGLDSKNGVVFLSPFAILIPSMFLIVSKLESTTGIASYIRVFLEPELGLMWQTKRQEIRDSGLVPSRGKYVASIWGLYFALCAVSGVLAYLFWGYSIWSYVGAIVPIGIVALLAVLAMVRAFSEQYRADYDKAWTSLRDGKREGSSETGPTG